ncbi:MAG: SMC-Scp complex subunit ScpB [Rhodospirillales bacterium]|nr:SMC-Scp complex subunit ScpB [Rhodospirillales bacterium]
MSELFQYHLRLLEALLFASENPIPEKVMADRLPEGVDIQTLLRKLAAIYKNRGVNLVKAGKNWAFRTAPDVRAQLVVEKEMTRKLSRAAVETLAIVAYHQPITRAEIEEIRGVSVSRGTLDVLLEAAWIRPRGRRRTPGRPVTWGTTESFLDHFGLEDLDDLPGLDDLKASGLIDKRPAIQTLTTRGNVALMKDPDMLEEVTNSGSAVWEPLDPDQDDVLTSEEVDRRSNTAS